MGNVTLEIGINSAPAKSGAAEIRAELDSLIAKAGSVWSAFENMGAKVAAGLEASSAASARATTATEKLTSASKAHKSAIETEEQQLARLKAMVAGSVAEYEKAYSAVGRAEVASKKYAAAMDEAAIRTGAGKGTFSSLTAALDAYSAGSSKAGSESTKAATALSGLGAQAKNAAFIAQQAGWQISDMAAQAANGTLNLGALGVQIGQFTGAFGAYGAAAGAAITVGGVLADVLIRGGNSAKEAAAKQREYNGALDAGQAIIDRYVAALDKANGKGETWRQDRSHIIDLQTQLSGLELEMEQLQRNKERWGSTPLMGTNGNEIEAVRAKVAGIRTELREAQKALLETPVLTISAAVRPGSQDLTDLKRQQDAIQTAINAAASANNGKGDEAKLKSLTETYEALTHAIASFATESEKATLRAEAQAKAATMGANEAKKYLAARNAEIDLMGKAVVAGERENSIRAASVGVAADQAKAYTEAYRQIALVAVNANAALAVAGVDAEKQRINQRRALLEISGSDEIALIREQDDKRRAIELKAAEDRLAVLRKTHPEEYAQIDAAERAITELRAKHALERQKQFDAEVAARAVASRQMAQIEADLAAQQATAALSENRENLSFGVSMGDINAADALAQERQIAELRYQIEKELLERKLQLAGVEEAERARINAQLVALEQQRSLQTLQIDHKETTQRVAEVKQWTDPVKQGVNATVQGFVAGSNTMGQAARRGALTIASSYISKFTDVAAEWFNKRVIMAAWDRLFASQSVATTAAAENTKKGIVVTSQVSQTAAAKTGATARATISNQENSSFFGKIGEQISAWFGFEEAKTGATVANEVTRTGTAATGAEARAGIETTETAVSVGKSAARGGAAAGADAAEHIPYGWLVAPAIAAATFAMIMKFASARGGWGKVPGDDIPTLLHQDEMVLPASIANPLRDRLTQPEGGNAALDAASAYFSAGTAAHSVAAMSALKSWDQMAVTGIKMPQVEMAGARLSIPDYMKPPAQVGGTVNNSNTNSTFAPTIHVAPVFHLKEELTDDGMRRKSRIVAEMVHNEIRNFNPIMRKR